MTAVVVQKLADSDGFIVSDLEGAPASVGIVRLAPKILVDGATTLARSMTYLYASFGQQIGGASAGINAKPEDRATAIEAFVAQAGPAVADGSLRLRSGKGLGDDDLEPLRTQEPAPVLDPASARSLLGTGVRAAAVAARGGLDGARVAIDGLDLTTASVVADLAEAGATIVAVATTAGAVADPAGIEPGRLTSALDEHRAGAVEQLDLPLAPAGSVFAAEADVVFTGSKVGAIDHAVAASITAGLVVPIAPVPVTAKALAVLRRAGTVVLPDFLSVAGPWFPTFTNAPGSLDELRPAVADAIGAAVTEVVGVEDGPLLGACYRAESFLSSWQSSLPFGRPLA